MPTPTASSAPPQADAPGGAGALPDGGLPAATVRAELTALRAGDHRYRGGTVFNSICSQPLPIAAEVFAAALETNMGDNRVFPSLPTAERLVARMLGELLGLRGAGGCATSGGTEANLLAVRAALAQRGRRRGPATVVVADNAHYSFDKLAAVLPIRLRRVPLDRHYRIDIDALWRAVDGDTALVVVTAGTSECGAVDDVSAAARVAAAAGAALHVDAATGGFLTPFAAELGLALPPCDFSVPEVASVTVDPHKYGGVPVPAGFVLFRDQEALARLRTASHYTGTRDQHTLLGTRPGAGVLATYAALRHLGRDGYRRLAAALFRTRDAAQARLEAGGHTLAFEPDLTVLGLEVADPAATLAHLERRGLLASVSRRFGFLRLVVQRHLGPRDFERLAAALEDDPPARGGMAPCA